MAWLRIPEPRAPSASWTPATTSATRTAFSGDDGYPTGCVGTECSADTGNWYEDGHGHGTHVSGTILAVGGNEKGVVGVNPDTLLRLHMVKVFNDQGGWAYGSDLIWALEQCQAAGANIVSMSLGGSGSSAAEQAAFDDAYAAGVLLVAAAGNGGSPTLSYPASYDAVMSVAAVDSAGSKASFSQFNHQVEIAGPGVGVLSTLPGNDYAAWNGTSMATPHVSGAAALVWGHHEACAASDIRAALIAGARDLGGPGWDASYGYGLVQAVASSSLLAGSCSVLSPPPFEARTLENGVPDNVPIGREGDEFRFTLEVPAGATDLRISTSGGSGDADLYVRHGTTPAPDLWDCRPYINGNSESCVEENPAPGAWHIMIRAYIDFTDVDLVASYVPPDSSNAPLYFAPDADLPISGSVTGSYRDLEYNDGLLQTLDEEASGGKPSRRYSTAEHIWQIPGISGGASVSLHLVAAGTAN
ncbi:MAG: S8 family serine peptidase, partial [Anaerolineae bacterium]